MTNAALPRYRKRRRAHAVFAKTPRIFPIGQTICGANSSEFSRNLSTNRPRASLTVNPLEAAMQASRRNATITTQTWEHQLVGSLIRPLTQNPARSGPRSHLLYSRVINICRRLR